MWRSKYGRSTNYPLNDYSFQMLFFLAISISFVGSLPLGALNLTAINIRMRQSIRALLAFCLAAAIVEWVQVLIAVSVIGRFQTEALTWEWAAWLSGGILLAIGLYYLLGSGPQTTAQSVPSGFSQGILLSLLNPLAIPFWLFWSFTIGNWGFPIDSTGQAVSFSTGVSLGTFLALLAFGSLGYVLQHRLPALDRYLSRIIGWTLVLLGGYQLVRQFIHLFTN